MRWAWDGVDVTFHNRSGVPEFDFLVEPGVDVSRIRMQFQGARSLTLEQGALVLRIGTGEIRIHPPASFSKSRNGLSRVESRYVLLGKREVGLEVDRREDSPLLIDPVLSFSTYIGGDKGENGTGLARVRTDVAGNVYTAGTTSSAEMKGWPMLRPFGGGTSTDAFLVKTTASGRLIYATYFGGEGTEELNGMAVDDLGRIVIGGATSSPNLPVIKSLHPRKEAFDGFVARFTASGELDYSTYFGGTDADRVLAVTVDSQRRIVFTGATGSSNLPTTNALMPTKPSTGRCRFVFLGVFETTVNCRNVFVAKVDPDLGEFVFSTYLGGARINTQLLEGDIPYGIVVDALDNVYVAGQTAASDFPVTENAFRRTNSGSMDGFITKLSAEGAGPYRSTYFGGQGVDIINAIAVDGDGNSYVCGVTTSSNLPTASASQPAKAGEADAFVAKLNEEMTKVLYSTYHGGDKFESCLAIARHPSGTLVTAGGSDSTNLKTHEPLQNGPGGGDDGFIVVYGSDGQLTRSSYFGGSQTDTIVDLAIGAIGELYLTGQTNSEDFPLVVPLQDKLGGSYDGFLTVFSDFLSSTVESVGSLKVQRQSTVEPAQSDPLAALRATRTADGGILLTVEDEGSLLQDQSRMIRQMEQSDEMEIWIGDEKVAVRHIRGDRRRAQLLLEASPGMS
ncbi:MAG TPA: SBBP repeat-containing protein, partial [Bryobacteraceae bacterium]|nr:SBBP repeat-containing protein [Bryobacteraceae bacterium]